MPQRSARRSPATAAPTPPSVTASARAVGGEGAVWVRWAQLRRWDPAGLADIGRELRTAGNRLLELRAGLVAARPDEQVWQGVAAEQACWVPERGRGA